MFNWYIPQLPESPLGRLMGRDVHRHADATFALGRGLRDGAIEPELPDLGNSSAALRAGDERTRGGESAGRRVIPPRQVPRGGRFACLSHAVPGPFASAPSKGLHLPSTGKRPKRVGRFF